MVTLYLAHRTTSGDEGSEPGGTAPRKEPRRPSARVAQRRSRLRNPCRQHPTTSPPTARPNGTTTASTTCRAPPRRPGRPRPRGADPEPDRGRPQAGSPAGERHQASPRRGSGLARGPAPGPRGPPATAVRPAGATAVPVRGASYAGVGRRWAGPFLFLPDRPSRPWSLASRARSSSREDDRDEALPGIAGVPPRGGHGAGSGYSWTLPGSTGDPARGRHRSRGGCSEHPTERTTAASKARHAPPGGPGSLARESVTAGAGPSLAPRRTASRRASQASPRRGSGIARGSAPGPAGRRPRVTGRRAKARRRGRRAPTWLPPPPARGGARVSLGQRGALRPGVGRRRAGPLFVPGRRRPRLSSGTASGHRSRVGDAVPGVSRRLVDPRRAGVATASSPCPCRRSAEGGTAGRMAGRMLSPLARPGRTRRAGLDVALSGSADRGPDVPATRLSSPLDLAPPPFRQSFPRDPHHENSGRREGPDGRGKIKAVYRRALRFPPRPTAQPLPACTLIRPSDNISSPDLRRVRHRICDQPVTAASQFRRKFGDTGVAGSVTGPVCSAGRTGVISPPA